MSPAWKWGATSSGRIRFANVSVGNVGWHVEVEWWSDGWRWTGVATETWVDGALTFTASTTVSAGSLSTPEEAMASAERHIPTLSVCRGEVRDGR